MANNCANYIEVEGIDSDVELFMDKFNDELDWLDDLCIDREHKTIFFLTKWSPNIEDVKDMAAGGTLYVNYFYQELSSDVFGVAIISPEGEYRQVDLSEEEIDKYVNAVGDIDYEGLEQLLRSKI